MVIFSPKPGKKKFFLCSSHILWFKTIETSKTLLHLPFELKHTEVYLGQDIQVKFVEGSV